MKESCSAVRRTWIMAISLAMHTSSVPLGTAIPADATGPRAPYFATSASQSVHPVGARQHVAARYSKDNKHNHGGHDPHHAHFGFFSVSFIRGLSSIPPFLVMEPRQEVPTSHGRYT